LFSGDEIDERIRAARLSFPSGHASFSAQAMVFIALYLQARLVSNDRSKPIYLVPFLQLIAVAFAIWVSLTRLTDFKHHPGDVLVGAILGAAVQVANVVFVQRLFVDGGAWYRQLTSTEEEQAPLRNGSAVAPASKVGDASLVATAKL